MEAGGSFYMKPQTASIGFPFSKELKLITVKPVAIQELLLPTQVQWNNEPPVTFI